MITCPNCREEIDEDSKFCDQCGKEIMYCPECKEPKRGTECPRCGEDLVSARVFLTNKDEKPATVNTLPCFVRNSEQKEQQSAISQISGGSDIPQGTIVVKKPIVSLSIIGNSWCLPIKEGRFGRNGGIYSEFSTVRYISGNHGEFRIHNDHWEVKDVGSTNGSFLNGQKMVTGQWYVIKKGDSLKIATINFTIG